MNTFHKILSREIWSFHKNEFDGGVENLQTSDIIQRNCFAVGVHSGNLNKRKNSVVGLRVRGVSTLFSYIQSFRRRSDLEASLKSQNYGA